MYEKMEKTDLTKHMIFDKQIKTFISKILRQIKKSVSTICQNLDFIPFELTEQ